MGLRNMTIGARLFIGFAIIFALVVLLGGMAYQLSNRLWKNTEDMHNFSLQASKATRDIKADIITMQWLMKDIVLDDKLSRDEILTIKNKIDTYEKKVYGSFDVVKESYLGNKSDIDTTYNLFSNWKPLRDIVIDLKQRGDRKEEYLRFRNVNIPYVSGLLDHIQFMVDAAGVRADNFYQQAQKNKDLLFTRLWIVTGFIFLLAFLIGYLLFRGIRNPLIALTVVADQYRQKNYSVRSDYISDNEIGNLASTFNGMAARVEQEISVKENASWIIDLILKENDLSSFSKVLLNILVTKTGSQVAAIYFLNEEETQYEHYDSIGLDKEKRISFSAITKEGEFGAALTEKRIVRIKQISADTIFSLPCVTGIVHPREIITIPILDGNKVISIISLAAINDYSPEVIQLINEIWLPLTANIIGVLAFRKVIGISEKLDIQNKELEEKSAELLQQTSELKEYNIELELQKRQLDEANHLKSSFLSNMSHELRTPLNSVIALSGVLNRQLKGIIPENEYKYLSIIEKNGKQLLLLINDILDLSRIEAGKEEISYSRFSIYDLVQDLMGSLQPIGIEKGISIINHINPKLPLIVSDHSKCLHILQNIIGNAIKFTNEGTVEISADVDNKFIHISVKDTGIGISVENTPYIFDEFRQADDKASRIYGGTGLGLAIASKYCNMLQGKVEVESQLHKGSVFTVTLPIMPDHLQIDENERNIKPFTDKTITPPAVSLKPVKGKNILLVEDNEAAII
ncbi:MAG: ATP-binding protein, partial [Bacteroidota bacterium]|nr:ATP-binding protein [Bacteroidota bacterium]